MFFEFWCYDFTPELHQINLLFIQAPTVPISLISVFATFIEHNDLYYNFFYNQPSFNRVINWPVRSTFLYRYTYVFKVINAHLCSVNVAWRPFGCPRWRDNTTAGTFVFAVYCLSVWHMEMYANTFFTLARSTDGMSWLDVEFFWYTLVCKCTKYVTNMYLQVLSVGGYSFLCCVVSRYLCI